MAAASLACFICCLGWGSARAGARSENAEQAIAGIARVDSLLGRGQAPAAVQEARRLFEKLGEDPLYGWQIEGRLGLALLRAGDPAQALEHLETVIRHQPDDHVAHRNLAAALLAMGRKGRALSEFRLVVELAPRDFDARFEYGQALAEFRDFKGAREQLEIAGRLCPDCLAADLALAVVLLESRDFASAVAPLEKLMARKPDSWARRNLGLALAQADRDAELLEFLDGLGPGGLLPGEMNLAVAAEGRTHQASRSLASVRALSQPDALPAGLPGELLTDPGFWGRVSLNLLESGHYAEGLAAADQAIGLEPDNVVFLNNRVVLLLKLGRKDEAAREWEKVLLLDPSLDQKDPE